MSIRDIIAAVTPGPWEHDGRGNICDPRVNEMHDDPRIAMSSDADARFIATFDPEHVALMEAVCEAASKIEFYSSDDGWDRTWLGASETAMAYADLQAYRKERGL